MNERAAFFADLEEHPYRHDFFMALRRLEALHADRPRMGMGKKPGDDAVRLRQDVSLAFAPAALARFLPASGGRPARLYQRFFGMFGPNGPLPLHLSDFARERELRGDATFARFVDVFHHRLLTFFYRAWAQAHPVVSLDRPAQDRFGEYVGALIGIAGPALRQRDAAGDAVKLFHAGTLSRQVRNAEGLRGLLATFFRAPVRIETFVGHWMRLPAADRTRLGEPGPASQLGLGLVLGRQVWDRQHRLRIHVGALDLAAYEDFLPNGRALPRLVALVRQYLCLEFDWDVRLVLRADQQPALALDGGRRLGWTTWLGRRRDDRDRDELVLDAEAVVRKR